METFSVQMVTSKVRFEIGDFENGASSYGHVKTTRKRYCARINGHFPPGECKVARTVLISNCQTDTTSFYLG